MTYPFLGDALALATVAHHGQTYGFDTVESPLAPYVNHPIAVAQIILSATGDPELAAAGLLHDTVEDTFVTLDLLHRHGFSRRIIHAVDGVTRRKGELYRDFVARAAKGDDSRRVKLADNEHNLSSLPEGDGRYDRYLKARRVLLTANGGVNLSGSKNDPWVSPDR